jgi:hypothetical protein
MPQRPCSVCWHSRRFPQPLRSHIPSTSRSSENYTTPLRSSTSDNAPEHCAVGPSSSAVHQARNATPTPTTRRNAALAAADNHREAAGSTTPPRTLRPSASSQRRLSSARTLEAPCPLPHAKTLNHPADPHAATQASSAIPTNSASSSAAAPAAASSLPSRLQVRLLRLPPYDPPAQVLS